MANTKGYKLSKPTKHKYMYTVEIMANSEGYTIDG